MELIGLNICETAMGDVSLDDGQEMLGFGATKHPCYWAPFILIGNGL
ncbi:hypothetical protein [Leptothoe sp. PORK10 BA2]|nr:hypothetical protein [Leptothoe sp. PORK10 BA2]MEA5464849.1 hypothetical protein [Leptothoe sp. PORK10 BA2]